VGFETRIYSATILQQLRGVFFDDANGGRRERQASDMPSKGADGDTLPWWRATKSQWIKTGKPYPKIGCERLYSTFSKFWVLLLSEDTYCQSMVLSSGSD
jgi:hypothetical protein